MFTKIRLLLELFSKGKQVRDKSFWLQAQSVVIPILVSILMAGVELAKAFGYNIPLDSETCYMLAGVFYFVVNTAILFATNHRLGFGKHPDDMPQGASGEAKQALPKPSEAPSEVTVPMPSQSEANAGIDDDTRKRAEEWLARQTQPGGVFNTMG